MKTFLVTMEDDARTKWLFPDEMIATTIQYCAAPVCDSDTTGPKPKVTVRCIESKTPVAQ